MINLILGEELLPYSVLSTTSTICELKFGKDRRIVAHYKEKDPETGLPTRIIHLTECQAEKSEQGYLEQISPYVHVNGDREKGSAFKKIELFWPHHVLEVWYLKALPSLLYYYYHYYYCYYYYYYYYYNYHYCHYPYHYH